jgi:hypothetical protein
VHLWQSSGDKHSNWTHLLKRYAHCAAATAAAAWSRRQLLAPAYAVMSVLLVLVASHQRDCMEPTCTHLRELYPTCKNCKNATHWDSTAYGWHTHPCSIADLCQPLLLSVTSCCSWHPLNFLRFALARLRGGPTVLEVCPNSWDR